MPLDTDGQEPAIATNLIVCPRCGNQRPERFYGPCSACRAELVATIGGAIAPLERAEYEPRMNVVPNHVATKD